MTRKLKIANYEETLNLSVTLREVLPSNHLARFVVDVMLGSRQFSLRGLAVAAGEWGLVCLAFNLKRLHTLLAT